MSDQKVELAWYRQLNNPNNQHYPQQVNQNYQQTGPISSEYFQQPYIQGHQLPSDTYNQQGGAYQPITIGGNYNSNANPLQQPYNAGIPGSVAPVIGSKETYKGFYYVLWFVLIWESLIFGYVLIEFLIAIANNNDVFTPSIVIKWIIGRLLEILPIVTSWRLIKGFQTNEPKPFRQGKCIFICLFVYLCLGIFGWITQGIDNEIYWDLWPTFILAAFIPAIASAYIIWGCDNLAKLFENAANVHATVSQV